MSYRALNINLIDYVYEQRNGESIEHGNNCLFAY